MAATGKSRTGPFQKPKRSRLGMWTGIAVGILLAAYAFVIVASQPRIDGRRLDLTEFVDLVQDQKVSEARILDVDAYVVGSFDSGTTQVRFKTPYLKEGHDRLIDILLSAHVPTSIDQQNGKRAVNLASLLLPGLILVVLFVYLILSYRQGTGLFGIGSGARRSGGDDPTVTFADVAGQDAALAEIREVADFLAAPARFTELGAAIPKGVLLFGPPGCGKTLLARALAGEAGASFWSIAGSDFVELYAGVGAARVRDLFRQAREHAPAIVFIDELDAVGRSRTELGGFAGGSGEQEQALNQILSEMDGFTPSQGLVVLAATNRPDVLDPALLRPGRFDRSIGLERPDEPARLAILELHARSKRLDPGTDLGAIAHGGVGLTGADLANVMNEAALLAVRAGKAGVSQAELDQALQRVVEAPERQRRLSLRQRSIGRRSLSDERVTFADVAGVDDAIDELAELKDYLAEPERFARMGARVPRGILLSGPPGSGKTLLARAVAGEAHAAFLSAAGSEFVERLAGMGAARVRELFADARSVAPAIVFIDEIDSVGGARSPFGGGDARDQALNQLLIELDGFEPRAGVIVMAATNRPDLLDPALLRPGRFDRHVAVAPPDRAGRRAILALHARDKRLAGDVDLDTVAGLTRGFSGADLANVLNEAALLTGRKGLDRIPMAVIDEAIDRTLIGLSSRAVLLSKDERRMVAYHEAGHALVARGLPGTAPPHKLTIVGRGTTLGHCTVLDAQDRLLHTRSRLLDHMAVALGGRAAETLVFGEPGSGSAADLQRVGELARRMVRELGMSDALGPVDYPDQPNRASEAAAELIDAETRRLAAQAHARALQVLETSRTTLDRVAAALLERESLTAADLEALASGT